MFDILYGAGVMKPVTFADVLASLILELTKKMRAELGRDIDPDAVEVILESTYVDDTLGGGTPEQVQRFTGTRLDDGTYTGTLPKILSKVGLHPKVLISDGEEDPDVLQQFSNKVLGHI